MNATSTTATMTADNTMVLPKRGRGRPRGILKKPLAPGAAPKPPKKLAIFRRSTICQLGQSAIFASRIQ